MFECIFKNYYNVYKIIKRIKPDVIISNFSYINPALLFGKILGASQNVAWFHTAFGHTKPSYLKIINKTFYLKLADVVIANSKQLQNEMNIIYGVQKDKTRAISFWTNISNHGDDSATLSLSKNVDTFYIGCPGRLVEDKNHKLAINAVYQLKKITSQPLKLIIAGDGPYKNELKELVNNLNLQEDVVFLGLLNVNEMSNFYNSMNVIVLPSFHEAFGLVFIEAIALGTPVLVSKSFGALDFIDEQKFSIEDFSFDPHSMQDLLVKLELCLEKKNKPSKYFKVMYDTTFEKDVIYNQVKSVILNKIYSS